MQLHVARVSRTSRLLVPKKREVHNEEAESFASLIQENKKNIPACFTNLTPGHVGFPISTLEPSVSLKKITKTLTVRSIHLWNCKLPRALALGPGLLSAVGSLVTTLRLLATACGDSLASVASRLQRFVAQRTPWASLASN